MGAGEGRERAVRGTGGNPQRILEFFRKILRFYLPNTHRNAKNVGTREVFTRQTREIKDVIDDFSAPEASYCPYCSSKDIVKRGKRQKKHEVRQRYYCNSCKRSFVPERVKGKRYPLKMILDGISHYNTGYSMEESCRFLNEDYGIKIDHTTLSDWLKESSVLCTYTRLRPYGIKLYGPKQVITTVHMYHRQVYDFSVHRAKLALVLQEHKHAKFENLREFLEAVQTECPHQLFKTGARMSEQKIDFSMEKVILRKKNNFANRIAALVLQSVSDNKLRHKIIQKFMLCNDSVTVAVEVPVYMDEWDLRHMQDELDFRIPLKVDRVITGHIDILQVRNGAVHILDYKPNAAKGKAEKTVNQLTLYALALSRLTGLRVYDFKCAWFDESDVALRIPEAIAEAHSQRFEQGDEIKVLEDALNGCNKAVVYLEQARDIYLRDTEGTALCEDLIKRYIFVRRKIFNLSRAWKRFKYNGLGLT